MPLTMVKQPSDKLQNMVTDAHKKDMTVVGDCHRVYARYKPKTAATSDTTTTTATSAFHADLFDTNVPAFSVQPLPASLRLITNEELSRHNLINDNWLAIDGKVYDVTKWQMKHPGGAKILNHYAGSDCSDAWNAMHTDMSRVKTHMKKFYIGNYKSEINDNCETNVDFRNLRSKVKSLGLMKPSAPFFWLMFLHSLAMDIGCTALLFYNPTSWLYWIAAVFLFACAQVQYGWLQHDIGHNSVASKTSVNKLLHRIVIGSCKGVSAHWWQFRHSQHHVVPNRLGKDPDISFRPLFLVGNVEPKSIATRQRNRNQQVWWPYQYQDVLFMLIAVPFLIPIYFHFEVFYFVFKRKAYSDLFSMMVFYVRISLSLIPILGFGQFAMFYYAARLVESFWFTFVTQSNHLPNYIDDYANHRGWTQQQCRATCNISTGWFNNWFTGHLNYQIEHHFFPCMPRCNYHKVAPMVIEFCKRNNLPYVSKPMSTSFMDCLRSLKRSGRIWKKTYESH